MLTPNPQNDGIWRGGLGDPHGGAPTDWIRALIKEILLNSLLPMRRCPSVNQDPGSHQTPHLLVP